MDHRQRKRWQQGASDPNAVWDYSETIDQFIHTLYEFCESHPEYEHTNYHATLESHGLEWGQTSMEAADVTGMDAKGVIALLIGAVRAERFCDGALLSMLEKGCISDG
jgi:hypothetical protein